MRIAIIGMGVAGISALREWTKQKEIDSSIKITVFGDKDTFGTGQAYQQDDAELLMNQAAEFTSIVPENDDDFVEWIVANDAEAYPASKFYPRSRFGEYITERMNGWIVQSKAEIIQNKVETLCILSNNQFRLTWASQTADFDAVHLCMGNLPYQDPYDVSEHPNAISNPFPMEEKLSQIPQGAIIGVVGTGLTSIDVFRYTYAYRPDVNVSFFSHSGTFKTVIGNTLPIQNRYFTKENIESMKEKHHGFIPLEKYIEWFKQELHHQHETIQQQLIDNPPGSKRSIERQLAGNNEIEIIQTVLKNIAVNQTELWMALTEADKQEFLHKYYKKWDKLVAPFPKETAADLLYAWKENTIRVFDNLIDIEQHNESFTCHLKDEKAIHVNYVINASGNDVNLSHEMNQMPLLQQLLNERILQPETFGGVQVTHPDLSVVSQRYGVLHTLKAHGQLVTGIQIGNSSVKIISESTRAAVEDIVQHMQNRAKV